MNKANDFLESLPVFKKDLFQEAVKHQLRPCPHVPGCY